MKADATVCPHAGRGHDIAIVRLFAAAREAAGTGRDTIDGATVREVLDVASARYGERFVDMLPTCRVWVNGDDADGDTSVGPDDEVAVLPPVSGGA
jgi:molybdopterin converting factor small subunit